MSEYVTADTKDNLIELPTLSEGDAIGFTHHEEGVPTLGMVSVTGRVTNIEEAHNGVTVVTVAGDDGEEYTLEQSATYGGDEVSVSRRREERIDESLYATDTVYPLGEE